ncbi:hypothetical protein ANCDUO_23150 [Ancylostoma duodenale]|uniref:Uncharacterized protein n=1 Tax=Ancylostoma duodenale TaxID=51022 RepID=A0A0C2FE29_9BILA|nr:hypothetical protein ANCDUO_23150 [Ancylostoma duodenale]
MAPNVGLQQRKYVQRRLSAMEMIALRWMVGVTQLDRICNDDIRNRFGVGAISDKLRKSRLQWYGHVLHAEAGTVRKIGVELEVPGKRPKDRPKQRWLDTLHADLKLESTRTKRAAGLNGVNGPPKRTPLPDGTNAEEEEGE